MPNPRDDSFVQTFYSDHKYSSITETSYNYVASTISVALIGLPFALSDLNLLIGSFVIGLTILSCNFTSKILILLSDTYKVYSIEDLTDIAFGKVCAIFILVIQLIFSITTISLTLRELSMTILSGLPANFNPKEHWDLPVKNVQLVVYVVGLLGIPLICAKRLTSIAYVSMMSVCLLACVGLGFFWDFSVNFPGEQGGSFLEKVVIPAPDSYVCVGVIFYAFGNIYNVLNFYNSLRRRDVERGLRVAKYSVNVVACISGFLSFVAFCAYLPNTGGKEPLDDDDDDNDDSFNPNYFGDDGVTAIITNHEHNRHDTTNNFHRIKFNIFVEPTQCSKEIFTCGGMMVARWFFVGFCVMKFPVDVMMARNLFRRLMKKIMARRFATRTRENVNVNASTISTVSVFASCCCCCTANDFDDDKHDNASSEYGSSSERSSNMSNVSNMSFASNTSNVSDRFIVGEHKYENENNHNVSVTFSGIGGLEEQLLAQKHAQQQHELQKGDVKQKYRSGPMSRIFGSALGLWLTAMMIAQIDRISYYIIIFGSNVALVLGVIFPGALFLKLGPCLHDFSAVAVCGVVPNTWRAIAVMMLGGGGIIVNIVALTNIFFS